MIVDQKVSMLMATGQAHWRFFKSTRGRIVALLLRGGATVEELAQQLGLTDNAVRAHLVALERDGFVVQQGQRRGAQGKPAYLYELTPAADGLFPRAYQPTLGALLELLAERLPAAELEQLLRDLGKRLAQRWRVREPEEEEAEPLERVRWAVAVLNEVGALAELEAAADAQSELLASRVLVRSASCPLAALVPANPSLCLIIEALLTELTALPVRTCCQCTERPQCCFKIDLRAEGPTRN
ncbi:MAG: helix-turn-helix domain-containing protein [Thermogemmatispora sp.]|uniref:helix-turn-helix transcriptional regulator n=2 Tax=Thermogemmatispora sp. TaxID=1968838 RepID=UPI001D694984|nr:helix-turn-helix domain-containing protein [Thermogemmatispora sp.]MBX5450012.1 helix-turn-helix domain-containing protein [Thermogemmatispora sp.]